MPKKIITKEELQANIAKAENEIRQGENYVRQLLQQKSQLERRSRTRRLIERGAIAESLIDDASNITNEQFKTLLTSALAVFKESTGKTPETSYSRTD